MQTEYEYIFGKHAVSEALNQRPDVVKQVFLDLNFSDAKLLKQIEIAKVTAKPLNTKKSSSRCFRKCGSSRDCGSDCSREVNG